MFDLVDHLVQHSAQAFQIIQQPRDQHVGVTTQLAGMVNGLLGRLYGLCGGRALALQAADGTFRVLHQRLELMLSYTG
jgi:hypothetical protein